MLPTRCCSGSARSRTGRSGGPRRRAREGVVNEHPMAGARDRALVPAASVVRERVVQDVASVPGRSARSRSRCRRCRPVPPHAHVDSRDRLGLERVVAGDGDHVLVDVQSAPRSRRLGSPADVDAVEGSAQSCCSEITAAAAAVRDALLLLLVGLDRSPRPGRCAESRQRLRRSDCRRAGPRTKMFLPPIV